MAQQPLVPGEVAERVGFKATAADRSWLVATARAAGISKSELIRRIIQQRREREPVPP
jgi:hypothetical protein